MSGKPKQVMGIDTPRSRIVALVIAALLGTLGTGCRQDFERHLPTVYGGHLEIVLEAGDITVRTHRLDSVRLEAHVRGINARAVRFELDPQSEHISLRSAQRGWRSGLFQNPSVEVVAWVPEHYSLDLLSGRGDVSASDTNGDVRIETDRGQILAKHIEGSTRLSGHRGEIIVDDVSGAIRVRNSQGTIRIRRAGGRVNALSDSGNISVAFSGAPTGHLATRRGAVSVAVPGSKGERYEAFAHPGYVVVRERERPDGDLVSREPSLLVEGRRAGITLGDTTRLLTALRLGPGPLGGVRE